MIIILTIITLGVSMLYIEHLLKRINTLEIMRGRHSRQIDDLIQLQYDIHLDKDTMWDYYHQVDKIIYR